MGRLRHVARVALLFFYEKSNPCLQPLTIEERLRVHRSVRAERLSARRISSIDSVANSFFERTDVLALAAAPAPWAHGAIGRTLGGALRCGARCVGARGKSGSSSRCPFLCCVVEQPSGGYGREVLSRGESLHATWHLSNSHAPARSSGWEGIASGLGRQSGGTTAPPARQNALHRGLSGFSDSAPMQGGIARTQGRDAGSDTAVGGGAAVKAEGGARRPSRRRPTRCC